MMLEQERNALVNIYINLRQHRAYAWERVDSAVFTPEQDVLSTLYWIDGSRFDLEKLHLMHIKKKIFFCPLIIKANKKNSAGITK